jgi:TPR repeat protein
MSNRIHVLINGEQFGPYPEVEFRQHVADMKIVKSDLVWREGLADWIPAERLLNSLDAARSAAIVPQPGAVAAATASVRLAPVGSPPAALELARQGAAQGNPEAQFQLSLMLFEGKAVARDELQATRWLKAAAEAGHAEAQYALGFRHANGAGVPRQDTEAVSWFRRAAEQHHAVAQCSLGYMLDHGRGTPRDLAEASQWYRKAAERGDAVAQNNLAMLQMSGQGMPKDEAEASRWFRRAAEQGVPGAQTNLGLLLAKGQGVPQDYLEAYQWFLLAASQGHGNAIKNRDLLAPQMTKEQIAEAQRRAARFVVAREPGLRPAASGGR